MVEGYDIIDINSSKYGRIDGYIDALHYISRHLLENSELEKSWELDPIIFLYYLVRYGLLSLLLLFIFLWKIALSKILQILWLPTLSNGFTLFYLILLVALNIHIPTVLALVRLCCGFCLGNRSKPIKLTFKVIL